jgi:hypothetical protein
VLVAFATATRLPAPLRSRRSRERERGARPATFRSGPSAARRRLQPPQPASTPARPPDPRPGQLERALARAARRPRFREARKPHRHARPKSRVTMTAPAPTTGGDTSPVLLRPFRTRLRTPWTGLRRAGWSPVESSRARGAPSLRGGPLFGRRPCGRPEESFSPTRSARTPLVMEPRPHRLETPALRLMRGCPLRGSLGGPTQGRITRPSAKRAGIRRTRGAFHRRAGCRPFAQGMTLLVRP